LRRLHFTPALALLFAAAILLASGFLFGATPDDEEYRSGVLSTQLHARALIEGRYLTWTSSLGFGMPGPLGPSLVFHPLMPLLGFLPADAWIAILLTVHLVLGGVGMWRLGLTLRLSPPACALCAATMLLATPTQNYVLTDFWPTLFVTWTTVPWLVIGFLHLIERKEREGSLSVAAATGTLGGLIVANGHPGYLLVYGPALLVLMAWHWRTIVRDWRLWTVVTMAGVAVAAPTLLHLATEFLRFPPGLPRDNYGASLGLAEVRDVLLRPFGASFTRPFPTTRILGTRTLFFGGPFALMAVAAVLLTAVRRERGDFVAAAAVSLVMLVMPGLDRIRFFTATYLFRDPLILFATPLAAVALDRLLAAPRARAVGVTVAAAQTIVLALSIWPFLQTTWATRFWPSAPGAAIARGTPLTTTVAAAVAAAPGRLFLTSGVSSLVAENRLRRDGLVLNSFAYLGVSVVNGTFKGISVDPIHPSATVPYGLINASPSVQTSQGFLDIAAIRYVLARAGETVAANLEPVQAATDLAGRTYALWRNPTASRGALVIDAGAEHLRPARRPGCEEPGFLCLDPEPLRALTRPGVLDVISEDGRIRINLDRSRQPRMLLVAEMFRPEWTAAPREVVIQPGFGGMMLVKVPPGVSQVVMSFRPRVRLGLTLLAWATILATGVTAWRFTLRDASRKSAVNRRTRG
jgi:hypothetical protein